MSWWMLACLALAGPDEDWEALMDAGRFAEAAVLAEEQAAEVEQITDTLYWLRWASTSHLQAGAPTRALDAAEKMLAAVEPSDDYGLAAALQVRGLAYSGLGRFEEARADQASALDHLAQVSPAEPEMTTAVQTQLAWSLEQLGELDAAESMLREVLATEHVRGVPRARALSNHASVLTTLGRLAEAQQQLEAALALQREAAGPDHPHSLLLLNNLAGLYRARGDLVAARDAYLQVQRGLSEVLPPEHPHHAGIANNLAQVLRVLGRPEEALDMLEAALVGWRRALGPEHPNVAATLINLASAHSDLGDTGRAREALQQAVTIQQAVHGNHPATAKSWMHLAQLSLLEGAHDDARRELAEARTSLAAVDRINASWADLLELEGRLARREARYDEALALLGEASDIWTALGGAYHPMRYETLIELARTNRALGHPAESLRQAEEALEVVDANFPSRSVEQLSGHLEVVHALEALDRTEEARERAALAWREANGTLDALARRASHRRWLSAARSARMLRSALIQRTEDPAAAWQIALDSRALARRSTLWTREQAAGRGDPETARLLGRLHAARSAWTEAAWSPLDTNTPREVRQAELDTLDQRVRQLEMALVDRTSLSLELAPQPSQAELCQAMEADEVLVDLVLLQSTVEERARPPMHGMAFVLRGGDCTQGPQRIELGELTDLAAPIDHHRRLLTDPDVLSVRVDAVGARLRERLWDPIADAVGDASRVWISAEGEPAGVSFAALPLDDGRYLLEEREFAYLESPQDLITPPRAEPAAEVVVVGGIPYDGADGDEARSIAPCALSYPDLPGTRTEAEQIGALWARRGPVTSLLGRSATEAAVQEHAANARVLQLATHGFFVHQACPQHPRDASSLWASGVVLADVGQRGDDDGLWTTAEVAGLDLQHTELVVLSACETGLGRNSALGVLGLRRAFAMAGVRHLVMSLWAVPDTATAELMVEMHRRLSSRRPVPVASALRQAQLVQLQSNRDHYGEGRPGAWGAFVVSGR